MIGMWQSIRMTAKRSARRGRDRLGAVLGHLDAVAALAQHLGRDHAVDGVVVDDQDAATSAGAGAAARRGSGSAAGPDSRGRR